MLDFVRSKCIAEEAFFVCPVGVQSKVGLAAPVGGRREVLIRAVFE